MDSYAEALIKENILLKKTILDAVQTYERKTGLHLTKLHLSTALAIKGKPQRQVDFELDSM